MPLQFMKDRSLALRLSQLNQGGTVLRSVHEHARFVSDNPAALQIISVKLTQAAATRTGTQADSFILRFAESTQRYASEVRTSMTTCRLRILRGSSQF
jgi:hypothetical protein